MKLPKKTKHNSTLKMGIMADPNIMGCDIYIEYLNDSYKFLIKF